jgi:hypothetical protein
MPYIPPHLRTQRYYEEQKGAPKIATTLAEAKAMSKAVTASPASVLSKMLSAPAPKLAGAVSHKTPQQSGAKRPNATTTAAIAESRALGNLHAAKPSIISASAAPVAAGSFSGMIQPASSPAIKPKKAKMTAHPDHPAKQAPIVTINEPSFDSAMDDILRTLFEDNMKSVKRTALANVGDFTRRASGSYRNERLESRFQGFKMQKLEECAGKAGDDSACPFRNRNAGGEAYCFGGSARLHEADEWRIRQRASGITLPGISDGERERFRPERAAQDRGQPCGRTESNPLIRLALNALV